MTVLKLVGNTITLNATPTVAPLATSYLANGTQGAVCLYIINNNAGVANITVSNSVSGNLQVSILPNTAIVFVKYPADTVTSAPNTVCSPIAKVPQ